MMLVEAPITSQTQASAALAHLFDWAKDAVHSPRLSDNAWDLDEFGDRLIEVFVYRAFQAWAQTRDWHESNFAVYPAQRWHQMDRAWVDMRPKQHRILQPVMNMDIQFEGTQVIAQQHFWDLEADGKLMGSFSLGQHLVAACCRRFAPDHSGSPFPHTAPFSLQDPVAALEVLTTPQHRSRNEAFFLRHGSQGTSHPFSRRL